MKPLKTYSYKGYVIDIYADDTAKNPRTEFDNVSVFAFFHKRYALGDKTHGLRDKDYNSWDELERAIRKKFDIAAMTPVWMLDHSGITIRSYPFNDPWDSGQIGFAWITKETARANWGWKRITKQNRKKLEETLETEIKVYNDYLTGRVYGYVIKDPNGCDIEDGSCWGWYGDDDVDEDGYAVREAKGTIDYDITSREKAERSRKENNPNQLTLGLSHIA